MDPLLEQMRAEMSEAGSDSTEDRPKLHIDGKRVDPSGTGPLEGQAANLCSVNARTFAPIAARLDVERLSIVEMRGGELDALPPSDRLTHLGITWATKLADVSALAGFPNLRFLELTDTPKVHDLAPLAGLNKLQGLIFQGGMWNRNRVASLAPLAELSALRALELYNLAVDDGGLRPLASLTHLKSLAVSNQFDTADYACLAVHLPDTTCEQFAAYQAFDHGSTHGDIMVTGKRKPFLKSRDPKDQARLAKYVAAFEALKAEFQAEIDHKSA